MCCGSVQGDPYSGESSRFGKGTIDSVSILDLAPSSRQCFRSNSLFAANFGGKTREKRVSNGFKSHLSLRLHLRDWANNFPMMEACQHWCFASSTSCELDNLPGGIYSEHQSCDMTLVCFMKSTDVECGRRALALLTVAISLKRARDPREICNKARLG
jgi:hypothetical protein